MTQDSLLYLYEKPLKGDKSSHQAAARPAATKTSQTNHAHSSDGVVLNANRAQATAQLVDRLDLSKFREEANKFNGDPLSADVFRKAHRRGERKEKQLRNIEKEHAMHEKGDLERLLNELKGHDWLKTMGISGITDTEKRMFEPKRDFYTRGVQALIDKFSSWREQEKELKLKKEQALLARDAAEQGSELAASEERSVDGNSVAEALDDTDASARQLQREAIVASRQQPRFHVPRHHILFVEPEPSSPFTSFYAKPYLREAALGKHRRGRSATAFGLPVPEPPSEEFALPDDFISEEALKENARKRRRLKRELASEASKAKR